MERCREEHRRRAQRVRHVGNRRVAMMELKVNGRVHSVDAAADTPLLYVLREDLQLNAAKYGCGLGQCGACTVMVDGEAVFSCVTPIALLPGRNVRTIEGPGMNAVQQAFVEEQ